MLRRLLSRASRPAASDDVLPTCSQQCHGSIYCAALNVHRLAETAVTALEMDRIHLALAELCELGQRLGSPRRDLAELCEWRDAAAIRTQQMRPHEAENERAPSMRHVEVYIATGLVQPPAQPQRVSA